MATACQSHVTVCGYFPDGGMDGGWGNATFTNGVPAVAPNQALGWTYQILPWIEQTNLWKLNTSSGTQTSDMIREATGVAMFSCPSRGPIRIIAVSYIGNQLRAMSDYAGNAATDNGGDVGGYGLGWGSSGDGLDAPITHQPDPGSGTPPRTVGPGASSKALPSPCFWAKNA